METVLFLSTSLFAFASISLFIYHGFSVFIKGGKAYRRHVEAKSLSEIEALYHAVNPEKFFFSSVCFMLLSLILFFALFRSWTGLLIGIPVGYLLPRLYLKILLLQRKKLFIKQLPDAVNLMANAMKAGNSLVQAWNIVAEEMEAPVSQEFHYMLQRNKMGESQQSCLVALDRRINNEDLSMIITATLVSIQTGSNLAEMYERLSETIRQKSSMKNKIKSLTSQGKMQGLVVGLLPVFLLVIINFINPGVMDYFLHSFIGGFLLSVGIVLEIAGLLFIRKIVNVDI